MTTKANILKNGKKRKLKADGTPDKRGGARPNSGKKPLAKGLTNYEKAIRLLDDNVEAALDVVIKGLKDTDKSYRYRCAELLLKKSLPDRIDLQNKFGNEADTVLSKMTDQELQNILAGK